jgi:hypothetical protein
LAVDESHGEGFMKGLDKLANIIWITNDLVAVGSFIGKTTPPQDFMIFRASNG